MELAANGLIELGISLVNGLGGRYFNSLDPLFVGIG